MRRLLLAVLCVFGLVSSAWAQAVPANTTTGVIYLESINGAFSFGGAITVPVNGVAATPTAGASLNNTTLSTAGVPVQMPPCLFYNGHVWNTTVVAADNPQQWSICALPTSGATPSGTLKIGVSLNGGATTYPLTLDSVGSAVLLGGLQTNGALRAGTSASIYWNGSTILAAPANGQQNITNFAGSAGIGFDVTTDGQLKVRTRAQTGDGNISFAAATASGTITTAANGTTTAPILLTNGTLLSSATANAIENDGGAVYNTVDTTNGRRFEDAWNYFRLTGSGSGITTIADFFGTNDGIPLVANGVYEIEWHCYFSQATSGTATWTIVTATTALANLTAEYIGSPTGGIGTVGAPQTAAVTTTSSSSTALPVTGTESTTATHYFVIHAILTAGNGASNTRLCLTMGAGTATPLLNSFFRVRRLPGANVGAFVS